MYAAPLFVLVAAVHCAANTITLEESAVHSFLGKPPQSPSAALESNATVVVHDGFKIEKATKKALATRPVAEVLAVVHKPTFETSDVGSVVCDGFEASLQKIVQLYCNTTKPVACVYGDTSSCSPEDICAITSDCGYIIDNDFVKFDKYTCTIESQASMRAYVTCHPVVQGVTWAIITVAAVLLICGCCLCLSCFCRRR